MNWFSFLLDGDNDTLNFLWKKINFEKAFFPDVELVTIHFWIR